MSPVDLTGAFSGGGGYSSSAGIGGGDTNTVGGAFSVGGGINTTHVLIGLGIAVVVFAIMRGR